MTDGTPSAELLLDTALVRRVLERQAPAWSKLPIEPFEIGWDNAIFRLGNQHLVRLPRRQTADQLLRNEQLILPFLQQRLKVAIPVPIVNGLPGPDFAWHWSILPYFAARTANKEPLHRQGAINWAEFMAHLHRPYLHGLDPLAPENRNRGVDINHRRPALEGRLEQLEKLGEPMPNPLKEMWQLALAQPPSSLRVWLHGDPHARNVLCESGSLAAVIDWGDVTTGDPASDLGSFWMLIHDSAVRSKAIRHYLARTTFSLTPSEANSLMRRARGWAVLYGTMLLATGLVDHPEHAEMGRATFRNLLDHESTGSAGAADL